MKNVCLGLWCLSLLGTAGGAGAEPKELLYSANPQYAPYHWAAGSLLAGASVELLARVLPAEVKAVPEVLPWKRVLEEAAAGNLDLVLSLRITPEREKYLKFVPHRAFPNPIVVFARRDSNLEFRRWEDLAGRQGGVSAGDTFGGGFDEYWKDHLTVQVADTLVENFKKLETGRIDWFVTSRWVGLAYLKAHPPKVPIDVVGAPISNEGIHFGFSARSPWVSLIPLIDQRLEALDRQGALDRLLTQYVEASLGNGARFPGE